MVVFDAKGRPDFSSLQTGAGPVTYIVFDVLQVDGRDVTALTYEERRGLLEQLVEPGSHWLVSPRHADGDALMDAAKARGLEGIVAKRSDSPYEIGRRSNAWRKLKYRPQQEFVVGGWVPGTGNREHTMGALLVGVYERRKLRYSGRVGTGFKERELQRLMARFAELASDECPFDPPPPPPTRKIAHWVRPEMVVEVAFAEWTHEDILRQPSYLAERDDKNPKKVVARDLNGQRPVWPNPPPRFSPSSASTTAERARLDRLDHELRDPVAAVDLVGRRRVGVHEHHPQLVAIARVDEAGRVQHGHPVLQGEAAAGQHEPGMTRRDGDREPRRHDRPASAGREGDVLTGAQISAGITRSGVRGQREIGIEAHQRDLDRRSHRSAA